MNDELLVTDEGAVRTLMLNRPERRNAISPSLSASLVEALIMAVEDPQIRVIIVTGAGDRAFCSGYDLKSVDESGGKFRSPMKRLERSALEVMWETYKPTIAAVNGAAVGGGFELMLGCDLRVVSETARLQLPEAKLGMGANFATVVLPRLVPQAIALQMLYSGDPIGAHDAARWGLANQVVPADQVRSAAAALAAEISRSAPLTLRRMKETIAKARDLPVASALRLDVGPDPYASADRQEGVRAYLEKRAPIWRGN